MPPERIGAGAWSGAGRAWGPGRRSRWSASRSEPAAGTGRWPGSLCAAGRSRAWLRGCGDTVEKVESGAVGACPESKGKDRRAGYAARARVRVTARDFRVVGGLVGKLAGSDIASVDGPWWSLRPGSLACRQARVAAAEDAARRAGEYAGVFGGPGGEPGRCRPVLLRGLRAGSRAC